MARSRQPSLVVRIVAGLLVALLVGSLLIAAFSGASSDDPSSSAPTTSVDTGATGETAPAPGISGLPTIGLAELPAEAFDTIELIVAGGPFPYDQDGGTFENREGLLPEEPRGYYREYTVVTPGEDDRGARRIVVGGDNDVAYWTDDHYESFLEITG